MRAVREIEASIVNRRADIDTQWRAKHQPSVLKTTVEPVYNGANRDARANAAVRRANQISTLGDLAIRAGDRAAATEHYIDARKALLPDTTRRRRNIEGFSDVADAVQRKLACASADSPPPDAVDPFRSHPDPWRRFGGTLHVPGPGGDLAFGVFRPDEQRALGRAALTRIAMRRRESGFKLSAIKGMQRDVVSRLASKGLIEASRDGDHVTVSRLLSKLNPADASAAYSDGWTALHHAAAGGHLAVINMLLAAEADINATTVKEGWTPLHVASLATITRLQIPWDLPKVVIKLIEAGADPNAKDKSGCTPLICAARSSGIGGEHVARVLISAGADLEARAGQKGLHWGLQGFTALLVAASTGNDAVVRLLLRCGANSRARGAKGETARELSHGYPSVVAALRRFHAAEDFLQPRRVHATAEANVRVTQKERKDFPTGVERITTAESTKVAGVPRPTSGTSHKVWTWRKGGYHLETVDSVRTKADAKEALRRQRSALASFKSTPVVEVLTGSNVDGATPKPGSGWMAAYEDRNDADVLGDAALDGPTMSSFAKVWGHPLEKVESYAEFCARTKAMKSTNVRNDCESPTVTKKMRHGHPRHNWNGIPWERGGSSHSVWRAEGGGRAKNEGGEARKALPWARKQGTTAFEVSAAEARAFGRGGYGWNGHARIVSQDDKSAALSS
jgi:hypothetical protein